MKHTASSFNEIYTSYFRRSYLFAKSYVHDDLAAEDIASESLIKLWQRVKEQPMEESDLLPFLLTILKNKALDYLRHEEVKLAAMENMAEWQRQELAYRQMSLEACNPDSIFSEEIQTLIRETMDRLSPQTREVFRLSRFENKSNREIAEALGISVKGVEYHISKALQLFRVSLKDYLPLFYFFFYFH